MHTHVLFLHIAVGVTRASGHSINPSVITADMALGCLPNHLPLCSLSYIQVYSMYIMHGGSSTVTSCGCRYMTLPPGSMGMYDPTEIRNRGMLLRFQKEAFVKIGYHLVVFFILLYW